MTSLLLDLLDPKLNLDSDRSLDLLAGGSSSSRLAVDGRYFLPPSLAHHTINKKIPIPVREINCHQPDFPTSCRRLAPTANVGIRIARETIQ